MVAVVHSRSISVMSTTFAICAYSPEASQIGSLWSRRHGRAECPRASAPPLPLLPRAYTARPAPVALGCAVWRTGGCRCPNWGPLQSGPPRVESPEQSRIGPSTTKPRARAEQVPLSEPAGAPTSVKSPRMFHTSLSTLSNRMSRTRFLTCCCDSNSILSSLAYSGYPIASRWEYI